MKTTLHLKTIALSILLTACTFVAMAQSVYTTSPATGTYTTGQGTASNPINLNCVGIPGAPQHIYYGGVIKMKVMAINGNQITFRVYKMDEQPFTGNGWFNLRETICAPITGNFNTTQVDYNQGDLYITIYATCDFTSGTVPINCAMYSETADKYYWAGTINITATPQTSYCNGLTTLTANSGSFTDGSGSNNYNNNTDCQWLIQPSGGGNITLNFSQFATETDYDYVDVYDGNSTSATRIGHFSGSSIPSSVTATSGSMFVRFTSDDSQMYQGWATNYSVSTPSYCNGLTTLTANSGSFTDGSGSNNYNNNTDCQWLIQPSGGGNITLNFSQFATETDYDFVDVYDGNSTSATRIGHFSGSSIPSSVTATSGSMFVRFTSDESQMYQGWAANYIRQTVANQSPTISITSPSNGATTQNSSITISGTASDSDGSVSYVQIKVGGGSWQTISGTTNWSGTANLAYGANTVYARAYDDDGAYNETNITVTRQDLPVVATPTFTPAQGTYTTAQNVQISCSTPSVSIYYTTNGSTPSQTNGTLYNGSAINISSTTTIKAKAYRSGYTESVMATAVYTINLQQVATPTFNPTQGTYTTAQNVQISCSTPSVSIYYTTNGSTPSQTNGTLYNGSAINVSSTTTIKAKAYRSGYTESVMATAVYTINAPCPSPTASFTRVDNGYINQTTNRWVISYQFTSTSQAGAGKTITNYAWNFGDGTPTVSTQNPSHVYVNGGTYNVSLTVTNSCGETNTFTHENCVSDLGFRPNPDGFSFYNFQSWVVPTNISGIDSVNCALDEVATLDNVWQPQADRIWNIKNNRCEPRFIPWTLFSELYGGIPERNLWRLYWHRTSSSWGGSCFGFSVASLLLFDNYRTINDFFPNQNLSHTYEANLTEHPNARDTINKYWYYQKTNVDEDVTYSNMTNLVNDLRTSFNNRTDNRMMNIFYSYTNSTGTVIKAGHSIVPYKIEQIEKPDSFHIFVYDNNSIANNNIFVKINTTSNIWQWKDNTSIRIELPHSIRNYANAPQLPNLTASQRRRLLNPPSTNCLIQDNLGNTLGYQNGQILRNDIVGKVIVAIDTINATPIEYQINQGKYNIQLTNSLENYLTIFGETTYDFTWQQTEGQSNFQTDQNLLNAINEEATPMTFSNTVIMSATDHEKIFNIKNGSISSTDTIGFFTTVQSNLTIKNTGETTTPDLEIILASANPDTLHISEFSVETGNSYKLIPDWQNLPENGLELAIDLGSDGIFNDTLQYIDRVFLANGGSINLVSSPITYPANTPIEEILGTDNVFAVLSDYGIVIPSWGVNTFAYVPGMGFKVYHTENLEFNMSGFTGNGGVSITLPVNSIRLIGFPYTQPHTAQELFGNYPEIIFAADDAGNLYIPAWGLTNCTFYPGKAIKVYATADIEYYFPELDNTANKSEQQNYKSGSLFPFNKTGEVYPIIIDSVNQVLPYGTELYVFDGDTCVGNVVYEGQEVLYVNSWLGNGLLNVKGANVGNPILLKAKLPNSDEIYDVKSDFKVGGSFGAGTYSVANITIETLTEVENLSVLKNLIVYPNPTDGKVVFSYILPDNSISARIEIVDVKGEIIKFFILNSKTTENQIEWEGQISGTFICKLIVNEQIIATQKFIVTR